ncbi:MAG TPA: BMP family ABC transporter substrate-binding protein [Chloroflexota bacterium]|nr:BMP family ABC transporter substrate-binding protein [Chloroflexota bacterium]
MRTRLLPLALLMGLISALVGANAAPRNAAAAMHSVTFVTDVGGLNDNGFNHLGYVGTTTGAAKVHWAWHVIETTSPSDYTRNLTTAAQQSELVIAVGFSFGDALRAVARAYPKVKFAIIDYDYNGVKPAPTNILGNDFMPNESSYLAGIVAAAVSKSHTIGFVGGLNVPLIQAFLAGYQAGAKSYDPSIRVLSAYTGSFTDQSKGKVAGLQEINAGADVIYAAAGASGLGSLAAADQRHVYGVGVDTDQHYLHPKSIITSVLKHVEVAVAQAIERTAAGKFKAGTLLWNLKNNGVGIAPFYNLASVVPAKAKAAVAKARQAIISGAIKVPVVPSK